MSKSNSGDEFSSKYIDFLINKIEDINTSIQALSNSYKDSLREQRQNYKHLVDAYNKGEISSKQIVKAIEKSHKTTQSLDHNIQRTARYNAGANKFYAELIKIIDDKGKITEELLDKIESAITNMDSAAMIQSLKENKKGTKDALFKNVQDNSKLKDFLKDLSVAMGVNTEGALYKLQSFFGSHFKGAKKTLLAFGADLIEGLAKNKFIGGAISDTIKLLGLLGANWLHKHFGKLGDKIGAGLVVLSQVIAGLLPTLIITGIMNGLTGGRFLKALSGVFKLSFNFLKNLKFFQGGKGGTQAIGTMFKSDGAYLSYKDAMKQGLGHDYAMKVAKAREASDIRKGLGAAQSATKGAGTFAKFGKLGTGLAKVGAGAIRGVGGLVAGLALEAGANFAVKKGANASLAHGISGAGQGAITGALLASWIPVIGPAVGAGVGAAIGGIAGVIKGFREESKDHNKTMEDSSKNTHSFWQGIIDWFKDHWPWGSKNKDKNKNENSGGGKTSGGSGNSSNPLQSNLSDTKIGRYAGAQDLTSVKKIGNLGINKYGQITNLDSMTQNQASDAIKAYMKQDKASFDRNYEILGSKYAAFGAFKNDAVIKDEKGNITGVLAAKGTAKRMDEYRDALRKKGVPENVINQVVLTGGMSTKTSPHKKGGAYSHSNIGGYSLDINVPQGKYGETIYDTIRDLSYEQGYDSKWEGIDKNGKFYFKNKYKGGLSNAHIDMKLRRGWNNPSEGALENLEKNKEEQQVLAERHSIDAASILMKEAGKEEVERINREANKNKVYSQDELTKMYEARLNEMGFQHRQMEGADGSKGVWVKTTDNGDKILNAADYPGNSTFNDGLMRNLAVISNQGV